MANITALTTSLGHVYLNGLIQECVIHVKNNKATILAMDLSASLFVQTTAELELDDTTLGVSDLALLYKYSNAIKELPVNIKQKDNRLILNQKKTGILKFLLAEADLIPSYDFEWGLDQTTAEFKKHESNGMILSKEGCSKLGIIMSTFDLNSIQINVDSKGKVSACGGLETEHQFTIQLGKVEDVDELSLRVFTKILMPVLATVGDNDTTMYLKEGEAILITSDVSSWVIHPIADEHDNE